MSRFSRLSGVIFGPLLLATTISCSRGPGAVKPPSINASSAGKKAVELYDKNGDGKIAGEELDHVPALKHALSRLDTDGDQSLTAGEISARIEKWQTMQTGLVSIGFTATFNGAPLDGATVTFEPEPFLGDDIKKAVATTDSFGTGGPSIPKELRSDPTAPPGIQMGFYRVKISKMVGGTESIPKKYNDETTLGQEVAMDVSEIANRKVVFTLSTK